MTRLATLIPGLLVAAPLGLACRTEGPPAPSKVVVSEPQANVEEPGAAAPSGVPEPGDVPKITADAAVHEFGAIKSTDSVEHVFTIRNAGTADLEIERVQPT